MKHFTLLYDPDISAKGWYLSRNSFLAAIRRRFFTTDSAYRNWMENGSFEIVETS